MVVREPVVRVELGDGQQARMMRLAARAGFRT